MQPRHWNLRSNYDVMTFDGSASHCMRVTLPGTIPSATVLHQGLHSCAPSSRKQGHRTQAAVVSEQTSYASASSRYGCADAPATCSSTFMLMTRSKVRSGKGSRFAGGPNTNDVLGAGYTKSDALKKLMLKPVICAARQYRRKCDDPTWHAPNQNMSYARMQATVIRHHLGGALGDRRRGDQ